MSTHCPASCRCSETFVAFLKSHLKKCLQQLTYLAYIFYQAFPLWMCSSQIQQELDEERRRSESLQQANEQVSFICGLNQDSVPAEVVTSVSRFGALVSISHLYGAGKTPRDCRCKIMPKGRWTRKCQSAHSVVVVVHCHYTSRIFWLQFIFVYFVRSGFCTKIKYVP